MHLAISALYSPVSSLSATFGNAVTNTPTWLIARFSPTVRDVLKEFQILGAVSNIREEEKESGVVLCVRTKVAHTIRNGNAAAKRQ